jgi:hypothetical protein
MTKKDVVIIIGMVIIAIVFVGLVNADITRRFTYMRPLINELNMLNTAVDSGRATIVKIDADHYQFLVNRFSQDTGEELSPTVYDVTVTELDMAKDELNSMIFEIITMKTKFEAVE